VFILDKVTLRDEEDEEVEKADKDGDAVTLGVITFVRDVVADTLGHEDWLFVFCGEEDVDALADRLGVVDIVFDCIGVTDSVTDFNALDETDGQLDELAVVEGVGEDEVVKLNFVVADSQ